MPTDYRVDGGMSLAQLEACKLTLASGEVVGLEIGELESDDSGVDPQGPSRLVTRAVEPLLARLADH